MVATMGITRAQLRSPLLRLVHENVLSSSTVIQEAGRTIALSFNIVWLLFFLLRCQHSVKHFRVEVKKNRIEFGQEIFQDVDSFIQHFENCPLIGDDAGEAAPRVP